MLNGRIFDESYVIAIGEAIRLSNYFTSIDSKPALILTEPTAKARPSSKVRNNELEFTPKFGIQLRCQIR